MTTQISESLIYQGQRYGMQVQPLETYFKLGGARPAFVVNTSMCWRGYSCEWSVDDGRLSLLDIRGLLALGALAGIAGQLYRHQDDYSDNPELCRALALDDVFPGCGQQVFAHWYSGRIEARNHDNEHLLIAGIRRGMVEHFEIVADKEP